MRQNKFIYHKIKTVITDEGGGRIKVIYKQTPSNTNDAMELARWAVDTVALIAGRYYPPVKIRMLVDNRKLDNPPLDSEIRNIYQEGIESDYLGKLAWVADLKIYERIIMIVALLMRHRDRVKYFPDIGAAKRWLGW